MIIKHLDGVWSLTCCTSSEGSRAAVLCTNTVWGGDGWWDVETPRCVAGLRGNLLLVCYQASYWSHRLPPSISLCVHVRVSSCRIELRPVWRDIRASVCWHRCRSDQHFLLKLQRAFLKAVVSTCVLEPRLSVVMKMMLMKHVCLSVWCRGRH